MLRFLFKLRIFQIHRVRAKRIFQKKKKSSETFDFLFATLRKNLFGFLQNIRTMPFNQYYAKTIEICSKSTHQINIFIHQIKFIKKNSVIYEWSQSNLIS